MRCFFVDSVSLNALLTACWVDSPHESRHNLIHRSVILALQALLMKPAASAREPPHQHFSSMPLARSPARRKSTQPDCQTAGAAGEGCALAKARRPTTSIHTYQ